MFVSPPHPRRNHKAKFKGQKPLAKSIAPQLCLDHLPTSVPFDARSPPPPYTVSVPFPQTVSQFPPYPAYGSPGYHRPALAHQQDPWLATPKRTPYVELTKAISRPLQAALDCGDQWHDRGSDLLSRGTAVCDLISSKFDAVITSIDGEVFSGDERELVIYQAPDTILRGGWGIPNREVSRTANNAISSAVTSSKSTNYFAKVNLYANSKLPPNLPSLKLYIPSYPLICLAAQYSQRVYSKPMGKEREAHVEADWRMGTKAMVIKSIPIDHMDAVVFAIRGSQTFMDWAVNLNSAPSPPTKFLDDTGNLCHTGFLSVARKMIRPVAARLRTLLQEDPSRCKFSLILTGHSAGGAVASLLFAHMMAEGVNSELNILSGCFKRIHCITFGSPPISLLPLWKSNNPRYRKSLFLSFINEGDPVPRADRAYIRSLFDLYASPAPGQSCISSLIPSLPISAPKFKFKPLCSKPKKTASAPFVPAPVWNVPPGSLSNAGRLVVLRLGAAREEDDVRAVVTTDQQLRHVVFGDPVMHMMKVYARRVEILATKAVTAKIWA